MDSYSPLNNYGYVGSSGLMTIDGSPTINGYSGGASQYVGNSGSPDGSGVLGGSWYNPSEGNIHIIHNGDILRKVDPGKSDLYMFKHIMITKNLPLDSSAFNKYI